MSHLAVPSPAWSARLHAEYVVELARARLLVLPLIVRLLKYITAVSRLVEELPRLVRLIQDVLRRHAQHLHNLIHLIDLVRPGEQRLTRVHLHENAAERPHVDGQVVRDAQQHLRRAVET